MPRLPITSLFAALLTLLLFTLTMTVIVTRMATKTDLALDDRSALARRSYPARSMIFTISPSRVIGTMLTNWSLLLGAVLLLIDVLGSIRSSSPTGGI
jgi:uncharacterized membrane protein YecN with MAPEG domain